MNDVFEDCLGFEAPDASGKAIAQHSDSKLHLYGLVLCGERSSLVEWITDRVSSELHPDTRGGRRKEINSPGSKLMKRLGIRFRQPSLEGAKKVGRHVDIQAKGVTGSRID